jgi:hypothetical protein
VSVPQWTWKELYGYYATQQSANCQITTYPLEPPNSLMREVLLRGKQSLTALIADSRETLSAYVLHRMPRIEQRLTALYRCRQTARQITEIAGPSTCRPCHSLLGEIPGKRLKSLSDSRQSMLGPAEEVCACSMPRVMPNCTRCPHGSTQLKLRAG